MQTHWPLFWLCMFLHDSLIWTVCLLVDSPAPTGFLMCKPYCIYSSEQPIFHVLVVTSPVYSYTNLSEDFCTLPVSADSLRRNVFEAFIIGNITDYPKLYDVNAYASHYIQHNVLEHFECPCLFPHLKTAKTGPRINTVRWSVARATS